MANLAILIDWVNDLGGGWQFLYSSHMKHFVRGEAVVGWTEEQDSNQ
jgi:hypothetical protein